MCLSPNSMRSGSPRTLDEYSLLVDFDDIEMKVTFVALRKICEINLTMLHPSRRMSHEIKAKA